MNLDWLFEEDITKLRQKIHFKDRYEYRVGGVKHHPKSPAVVYHNGDYEFWLEGRKLEGDELDSHIRLLKYNELTKKAVNDRFLILKLIL